jgi:hypothetical protein
MKVMTKRASVAGSALLLGAVMLFMFWINSVRDSDDSIISMPWPAQVAFHGVMNLLLAAGLVWFSMHLNLAGWQRVTWQVGAGMAAVGVWINYPLMTAGLVLIGVAEIASGRYRTGGWALISGSLCWFAVWLRGARFDSEDSLPLDSLERLLSTAGLVLLVVGIVTMGINGLRTRQASSA